MVIESDSSTRGAWFNVMAIYTVAIITLNPPRPEIDNAVLLAEWQMPAVTYV